MVSKYFRLALCCETSACYSIITNALFHSVLVTPNVHYCLLVFNNYNIQFDLNLTPSEMRGKFRLTISYTENEYHHVLISTVSRKTHSRKKYKYPFIIP